jgi:hypothetical protein
MNNLIESVEAWIDGKIKQKFDILNKLDDEVREKIKDMEEIHIRDAERIATLERRMMELRDPDTDAVDEALNERLDDLAERVHTLECEMYEVEKTTEDIPDTYSIEVMIDDALETKVMDAVKEELDATEFKVTIER